MSGGQVRVAVRRVEIPMLRAYRLWFEHTRKCGDGCKGAVRVQYGCAVGRGLWGAYRLARNERNGKNGAVTS